MERRKFMREFKLEAVRLIKVRGVSYAQASQDLSMHQSQLRSRVRALADDPQQAFPGHGQMKPEQAEITRLKREENERMSTVGRLKQINISAAQWCFGRDDRKLTISTRGDGQLGFELRIDVVSNG